MVVVVVVVAVRRYSVSWLSNSWLALDTIVRVGKLESVPCSTNFHTASTGRTVSRTEFVGEAMTSLPEDLGKTYERQKRKFVRIENKMLVGCIYRQSSLHY